MRKRLFTLALATAMLPGAVLAEGFTRECANTKEFNDALTAIGDGVAGDTYELVCTWKGSQNFKKGPVIKMKYGRLVVRSNETNFDDMPVFQELFYPVGSALNDDSKVSFIFENVSLRYCYTKANGKNANVIINQQGNIDTLAFRHCDLNDITQQFIRTYPVTDSEGNSILSNIDWFEVSQCKIHDCGLGTRQIFSLGHSVNHVRMNDNLIFDLPRVGSFYTMGKAGETSTAPDFYFNNNTVLVSNYKYTATNADGEEEEQHRSFCLLNIGDNLGAEATYHINNNIFMAPMKFSKENMMEETEIENEELTEWFGVNSGILYASHNVLDTDHYMDWERVKLNKADVLYMTDEDPKFISPAEAKLNNWTEGGSFQDPEKSIYYVEKSSPAYTMGIGLLKEADGGALTQEGTTSYLGASIMYVDQFPVKAAVNVTVNGPEFISYTIEPEKSTYYVDDEITITLNDKNTPYTQLSTFKGWSDGSMDKSRTFKLTGDLDLTANYEARTDLVSAFTTFTNNRNLASAKADIFMGSETDTTYQANLSFMVVGEDGEYVAGNGQSRPNKFGELPEDQQIPVILTATPGSYKFTKPYYAVIKLSTKDLSDVKVACVVGTDNNCCKEQRIDYSLDGTTYTNIAKTTVEKPFTFYAMEGTLPTEANGKDVVYVRLQGTAGEGSSAYTISDLEGMYYVDGELQEDIFTASTMYEYYGGIVISANTSKTGIEEVKQSASATNAPAYNMMGMRVPANYKGLVIKGGKKVFIK